MEKNRAISSNFGSVIKHARENKNYSLKDLEDITGISSSYINRLEHSIRNAPSVPITKLLSEALDLELYELLNIPNNKSESLKNVSELLLANDFLIRDIVVGKEVKELLVNIIEKIINVRWEEETKIKDAYEIIKVIDDYKIECAG